MMQKRGYVIRVSERFKNDLQNVLYYIAYELENPISAKRLSEHVYKEVIKRSYYPKDYQIYNSDKTRGINYYRIRVDNYFVYYIVIDNYMELRRFVYKKSLLSDNLYS